MSVFATVILDRIRRLSDVVFMFIHLQRVSMKTTLDQRLVLASAGDVNMINACLQVILVQTIIITLYLHYGWKHRSSC